MPDATSASMYAEVVFACHDEQKAARKLSKFILHSKKEMIWLGRDVAGRGFGLSGSFPGNSRITWQVFL